MDRVHSHKLGIFCGRPKLEFATVHTRGHWQNFGDNGMQYGDFRFEGPSDAPGLAIDITEVGASRSVSDKKHSKRVMVSLSNSQVKALVDFLNKHLDENS